MSLVPVLFGLISSVTKRIPLVLIPGLISGLAYVIPWSVIEVARDEGNNSRFGFLAFSPASRFARATKKGPRRSGAPQVCRQ